MTILLSSSLHQRLLSCRALRHLRASCLSAACQQVTTEDGHTVTADAIVQATDSPINVNLAIHARQSAYRSYVTGYKIPKVRIGLLPLETRRCSLPSPYVLCHRIYCK